MYAPDKIVAAVAKQQGLPLKAIMGHGRSRGVCAARHLAMLALRRLRPLDSLVEIGHHLNRDHTTVIHGIQRAKTRLDSEPHHYEEVLELLAEESPGEAVDSL